MTNNSSNTASFYHILNRGIENRMVFTDIKDLDRFISLLDYYRFKNPPARFSFRKRSAYAQKDDKKNPLVHLIAFCLMPNHFRLLLEGADRGSVSKFLSLLTNSYTKYFNARHKRSGPLFAGTFKAVEVNPDQLADVSCFIHTEPIRKGIVLDLNRFPFSSFQEYMGTREGFCEKEVILKNFADSAAYKTFLLEGNKVESRIGDLLLE